MPAVRITETSTTDHELSTRRLNVMRLGYAFMGVGLAIVQRIILEHGGRIRAEANYPRGARFVIELPAVGV